MSIDYSVLGPTCLRHVRRCVFYFSQIFPKTQIWWKYLNAIRHRLIGMFFSVSFDLKKDLTNKLLCFSLIFRYKLSLIMPSVKALMASTRTSIRTDQRGFLSMQYMLRSGNDQIYFTEYFVSI